MHPVKAQPLLIAAVCAYELGGLAGAWPTITALSMRLPRAARRLLVLASGVWLAVHLDCVARGSRSALSDVIGGCE